MCKFQTSTPSLLDCRRQDELEAQLIEEETQKRVEELVAKRVAEELERRKDEIEAEVLRRVEEAKKVGRMQKEGERNKGMGEWGEVHSGRFLVVICINLHLYPQILNQKPVGQYALTQRLCIRVR